MSATRKTEYDSEAQTVTLCFGEELPAGEVNLRLAFEGSINDKLAGLYRSKYTVRSGAACSVLLLLRLLLLLLLLLLLMMMIMMVIIMVVMLMMLIFLAHRH